MAELQPADGGFLWHAIYGGQCHGQPAGGEEGRCKGEPELGDSEQVFEQGRRRRENTGQGQGSFGFWIYHSVADKQKIKPCIPDFFFCTFSSGLISS